ncbi:60S ribosomal protein L7-4, partial [Camellia lanceoleosa]
ELDLIQMKHRTKRQRRALVTPESKLLLSHPSRGKFIVVMVAIFSPEKNDMHPKTRKVLYSLRLRKIFNGVFVKANERIMEILQMVEPFIAYGCPNLKSVKDLIYKKGLAQISKQNIIIIFIVWQELGKHGILCIEDIVNEIATVGPHFKEVTSFLCPFTLNRPEKGIAREEKALREWRRLWRSQRQHQ